MITQQDVDEVAVSLIELGEKIVVCDDEENVPGP